MKFPLSERPFPVPLALPRRVADDYGALVDSLLGAALRDYDALRAAGGPRSAQWKRLRRREALAVFRERASPPSSHGDWRLPRLLLCGNLVGSLDDVLLGALAASSDAMRVRATYLQDDARDGDVLAALRSPTADAPFEFLGLTWVVRASTRLAWPRDAVAVEASGERVLESGERVGFRVVHSVQLPQCPPLDALGIVRTRLSAVSLFRQQANGTVDVFMTRCVDSSGSLPDAVALGAAANEMIGVWKTVWCAQNKKLAVAARAGALRWQVDGAGRLERLVVTTDEDGRYCCGLCLKGYKLYSSVITCQACNLMVCSRCQVGRRLARVAANNQVTQFPVLFCKNCIARSTQANAWDVASSECRTDELAHELEVRPRPRGQTAMLERDARELELEMEETDMLATIHEGSKRKSRFNRDPSIATDSTFSGSLDGFDPHSYHSARYGDEDDDIQEEDTPSGWDYIQTLDDWDRELHESFHGGARVSVSDLSELTRLDGESSSVSPASTDDQHQLWEQMSQLCLAAEETYRLAKRNAEAMRAQQQPTY